MEIARAGEGWRRIKSALAGAKKGLVDQKMAATRPGQAKRLWPGEANQAWAGQKALAAGQGPGPLQKGEQDE